MTAANEEVGPSGVTFLGEQLYLLTASGGWEIGDPEFHNGLFRLHLDGTLERIFDYSAYTREHPTRARLQDPRADVPLGMPFGLAALDGMLYSTDGNQEQILAITPAGEAARIVEYPMSNRALTGIVAGPDGALYVAEFAARKITRVQADGLISDALTNVRTPPVAAAFDRDGRLYVLEYYTGRVTRVAQLGDEQREVVAEGFPQASAMVLGPDGNLYISFHGGKAKTGEIQSQDGQIVRLALSSTVNVEPGPSAVALLLLLGALILLGTGALVVWQVRRSRA